MEDTMKPTRSANRNSLASASSSARAPRASRSESARRERIAGMRHALVENRHEPVSLVVARFFTAA